MEILIQQARMGPLVAGGVADALLGGCGCWIAAWGALPVCAHRIIGYVVTPVINEMMH